MKRLLLSVALLIIGSSAVVAQNKTVAPAEPMVHTRPMMMTPSGIDWTGGYVGLGLGYGRANHPANAPGTLPNSRGPLLSALLGYNWQQANGVFGGELLLSGANLTGSAPCTNAAFECTSKISSMAALRGRVGVAMDRTLFFATAGVAAANVKHTVTNPAGVRFPDSKTLKGFTVGVGAEHALESGWNIRGDLEHYRFRSGRFELDVPYLSQTRATVLRSSVLYRF